MGNKAKKYRCRVLGGTQQGESFPYEGPNPTLDSTTEQVVGQRNSDAVIAFEGWTGCCINVFSSLMSRTLLLVGRLSTTTEEEKSVRNWNHEVLLGEGNFGTKTQCIASKTLSTYTYHQDTKPFDISQSPP